MILQTSEEKAAILLDYAHRYGIRTFIETGTNTGATVAALITEFDDITTIELSLEIFLQAEERFLLNNNVICLRGDSGWWLPKIIASHTEPILFWLDGHYSGGNTARGEVDTPIVTELEAAVLAPHGSVIIIDDARLFGGMPEHTEEFKDYPHLSWIEGVAVSAEFNFEVKDDIIRLTPRKD